MAHTPEQDKHRAPWHIGDESIWKGNIYGNDGILVATIDNCYPNAEANRPLIAAAPEMLEALKELLGLITRIQERTPIYESDGQIFRAEQAIRKAEQG